MAEIHSNYNWTYQQEKIKYFKLLLSSEEEDTAYIWTTNSNNEAILIYYIGNKTTIKVPRTIGGYPVKYIEPTCYDGLSFIENLIVRDNIISIG